MATIEPSREPVVITETEVNATDFFNFIIPRYGKFGYKGLATADHSTFRALITNNGFEQRISEKDKSKEFALNERGVFSRPHELGIDILFERDLRDGNNGFTLITVPNLSDEQEVLKMYRRGYVAASNIFNGPRMVSAIDVLHFDSSVDGFVNEKVTLNRLVRGIDAIATAIDINHPSDANPSNEQLIILNEKKIGYRVAKLLINEGHRINGFTRGRWHIPHGHSELSLYRRNEIRNKWQQGANEYYNDVKTRLKLESSQFDYLCKVDMSALRKILDSKGSGFEMRHEFKDPNTRYWPFDTRRLYTRPSKECIDIFFEGDWNGNHFLNTYCFATFITIGGPGGYEEFEGDLISYNGMMRLNDETSEGYVLSCNKLMHEAVRSALKIQESKAEVKPVA